MSSELTSQGAKGYHWIGESIDGGGHASGIGEARCLRSRDPFELQAPCGEFGGRCLPARAVHVVFALCRRRDEFVRFTPGFLPVRRAEETRARPDFVNGHPGVAGSLRGLLAAGCVRIGAWVRAAAGAPGAPDGRSDDQWHLSERRRR